MVRPLTDEFETEAGHRRVGGRPRPAGVATAPVEIPCGGWSPPSRRTLGRLVG